MSEEEVKVMDIANYDWPDVRKAVEQLLNRCMAEIRANMITHKVNATWNAYKSLNVKVDGVTGVIHGLLSGCRYFSMPEVGRRQGKIPEDMVEIIHDWSIRKGINFANEKERYKFSRTVAYTIKKYGSYQYRKGGRKTIFSDVVRKYLQMAKDNPKDVLKTQATVRKIAKTLFRGNVTTTHIKVEF